jgi:hypothetical protein
MRSILPALLLAATLLPLQLLAQRSGSRYLGPWNGGTNNIAGASTNTVSDSSISVEEHDAIGVAITMRPLSTSTGTVVFKFADAVGSYYESTPTHTITWTANGTNTVTVNGLFSTAGLSGFALVQDVSTNSMAMTNVIIEVTLQAPKRRIETR